MLGQIDHGLSSKSELKNVLECDDPQMVVAAVECVLNKTIKTVGQTHSPSQRVKAPTYKI